MVFEIILIFFIQKNNTEFTHIPDSPQKINSPEIATEVLLNCLLGCRLVKHWFEVNWRISIFWIDIFTLVL